MATTWTRRYFLIVRQADQALANTRYELIDPDTRGDLTFSIPLARTASPTVVVAYGANTAVTMAMVQAYADRIQDLIDAGRVKVYRTDNGAWTVESALADAWPGGLVVVSEEPES